MTAEQFESQLVHLPDYFAHHVLLSVGALSLGILFALPLAGLAVRKPGLAGPVLGVARAVQHIQGLALRVRYVAFLGGSC